MAGGVLQGRAPCNSATPPHPPQHPTPRTLKTLSLKDSNSKSYPTTPLQPQGDHNPAVPPVCYSGITIRCFRDVPTHVGFPVKVFLQQSCRHMPMVCLPSCYTLLSMTVELHSRITWDRPLLLHAHQPLHESWLAAEKLNEVMLPGK